MCPLFLLPRNLSVDWTMVTSNGPRNAGDLETSLLWISDKMFKFNALERPEAFQMDSLFADDVNAAGHQAYKEACSQGRDSRLD